MTRGCRCLRLGFTEQLAFNARAACAVDSRLFFYPGVSTTAGHDCLFEQSYPARLNKTLGKLLATAGVKFEAINVAMGNTRVAPYSWCVDAHAGLDADIISWDMTMMLASNQCGRAATGVELFIRSASVLPKRPAVLLTDASPDQVRLVRVRRLFEAVLVILRTEI